ncbi:MAG: ribonuclease R, partial [Alcanivoracaceae bacterium]
DPHAAREARKYENPVPSRELIIQVLGDQGAPMSAKDLLRHLKVKGEESEEAFQRRLRAMIRDGQLVQNRAGQFGIASRMDLMCGRIQAHRDGFGFFVPEDAGAEDLFVAPRQMQTVMHGDRVLVSVQGRNRFGKQEARIVEIVERGTTELVGVYRKEARVHFLEPQNRRISKDVLITDMNGLKPAPGDHVRTEILQYPGDGQHVQVKLVEIIASPDEPGMEVDVALRNFEIPHHFPGEALDEANAISPEVADRDKLSRVDLRDLPLVTIDGEDARDFDDAVCVFPRPRGGWRLIVAIADVSHYVHPDAPLDREAQRRATSVYFPNRVVPMLPEKLSNGLCSLNPHVDRLCLFCEMQISARGRITGFVFREGVMRSRYRLTYTEVGAVIEQPESKLAAEVTARLDDEALDMLWQFHELFGALSEQRQRRGAIDFDSVETRILYDDNKKIRDIVPVERNVAHRMIEEAMLAANICAARLLEDAQVPALFRNHEPPSGEKLETLQSFLGPLGLSLDWGRAKNKNADPSPAVFKQLTEQIADRPDRSVIQVMMLRSLTQAKYEAENKGHFGLAYESYAHFTSPIRRYPDLLVHRAIRYLIRKGSNEHADNPGKLPRLAKKDILPYATADMVTLGEHCSMAERRADDATRDVVKWLKCQYMEQHLGDEFEGLVSGVANFGLFIELKNLYIEGMVHVANLGSDYFHYDELSHALVGESSGQRYQLGDAVTVRVAAVLTEDRKIDLELVGVIKAARGARKGGKKGSGKGGAGKADSGKGGRGVRDALRKGKIPGDGKAAPKKKAARRKSAAGKSGGRRSKSGRGA